MLRRFLALVCVAALSLVALQPVAEAGPLRRIASRVRHPFRGACASGACASGSCGQVAPSACAGGVCR